MFPLISKLYAANTSIVYRKKSGEKIVYSPHKIMFSVF